MSATDTMLSFSEYMHGMCNAPWDDDECPGCGGNGLRPVWCCNGSDCGCMGMPVDFVDCECGRDAPSDEKIKEWGLL